MKHFIAILCLAIVVPGMGGEVTVREFGAKGDGVSDDFGPLSIAFQATKLGDVLTIPPGVYLTSRCLPPIRASYVEATGATIRKVGKWADADDAAIVTFGGTSGQVVQKASLRGLSVEQKAEFWTGAYQGYASQKSVALRLQNLNNSTVSEVSAANCYTGIEIRGDGAGCEGFKVGFNLVLNCHDGIALVASSGGYINSGALSGGQIRINPSVQKQLQPGDKARMVYAPKSSGVVFTGLLQGGDSSRLTWFDVDQYWTLQGVWCETNDHKPADVVLRRWGNRIIGGTQEAMRVLDINPNAKTFPNKVQ